MKHLIKKSNGQPVVTTDVIANEFGRDHFRVMNSIESLIASGHLGASDFRASSYVTKQKKELPCYELTERGFLIAMPFIGGEKAKDGQVRLVDSFIQFREKARRESEIRQQRDVARMEYRPMSDALKLSREQEGKETEYFHYSTEADMINGIVLGKKSAKFKKENDIGKDEAIRDYLTQWQIKAITELQRANTVFISMGWDYHQRKDSLQGIYNKNFHKPLMEEQARLNE
ncbi:TPA: Rha family transcriptional regulator [Morganella morganii]|nr:Rha family transcriptional regulator [Morganella morganii]HEI9846872.1 Rha family transcriptional regulator [Morganella morganii]